MFPLLAAALIEGLDEKDMPRRHEEQKVRKAEGK
jgi:hypothetical protein